MYPRDIFVNHKVVRPLESKSVVTDMVVYLVQLFIVHDFVLESHFTGLCVHVCCLYDAELFQKALFEVFVPKKLEFKLVLELEELPGLF